MTALCVATSARAQDEVEEAIDDAPHCSGTGVEGVVRDAQTGETLIEAPVVVVGRPAAHTLTDYEGRFAIDLPPGTYTLRAHYDLYEPARVENLHVRAGACTTATIELSIAASSTEEVVIEVEADRGSEATQLRARRESATQQDAMSAEEIRRTPDSTVSAVVRRMVGATLVGGSYLFVRGLGGRYTGVSLNGAPLPSTDPDVPGVQLDVFPVSLLTNLTLLKSFMPDQFGDAAGGQLVLQTRDFPRHFTVTTSLTAGVNTETTFQPGLAYHGGGLDFLGFDDGTRSLPAGAQSTRLRTSSMLTRDQLDGIARTFPSTWGLSRQLSLPYVNGSLTFGDTIDLGGSARLGYTLSFSYQNNTQRLFETVQTLSGGEPGPDGVRPVHVIESLRRESLTNTVLWSALGASRLALDRDNALSVTAMFIQSAEAYAGYLTGSSESLASDIAARRLRWVQRSLAFGQIAGEHDALPFHMQLHWQVAGSLQERDEPDTRDVTYRQGPNGLVWYETSDSGQRLYSTLGQREANGSWDLTIPVETARVRIGMLGRVNDRDFSIRTFQMHQRGMVGGEGLGASPDVLFSPDNIGAGITMDERTRVDDSYHGSQQLGAAFAMLDWQVFPWARVAGGLRVEAFRQTVRSVSPFAMPTTTVPTETDQSNIDPLPAAALVLTLTPEMQLRFNYGHSVARPQARELAPFQYPDFIRRRIIIGNAALQRSLIHSADVRWEWFPGANEVVAVTGFAKQFDRPIESVTYGVNSTYTFDNAQGAQLWGGEFEGRLSLARIAPELGMFSVGANLTLVWSQVTLTPEQQDLATSRVRPLSGQSPWVVNASVVIEPPGTGLHIGLFYTVFGPRIVDVGRLGLPDVYQLPLHQFDVTALWDVSPIVQLRANVTNLFYDDFVLEQGNQPILQYNPGLNAQIGLTVTTQ